MKNLFVSLFVVLFIIFPIALWWHYESVKQPIVPVPVDTTTQTSELDPAAEKGPEVKESALGDTKEDITVGNTFTRVNNERVKAGLPALKRNAVLEKAAQAKLNDMLARDYFAHETPEGDAPWVWFSRAGYDYVWAGENLAHDFSDESSMVEAWMNSPTHRKNILKEVYKETGIAVSGSLVVQEFGSQTY